MSKKTNNQLNPLCTLNLPQNHPFFFVLLCFDLVSFHYLFVLVFYDTHVLLNRMSSGILCYFGSLQLQWTLWVSTLRGSVWRAVWLLKGRLSSRAWMSCNKYVVRTCKRQKDSWGPNEHLISFNFGHFFLYISPFLKCNINSLPLFLIFIFFL